MHIDKILINNFKNYKTYKASFIDGINYLFGENGVGKTNLLDAIYYLSLGKSAINTKDDENIRKKQKSFRIEGFYSNINSYICYYDSNSGKKLFENNNFSIIGNFPYNISSQIVFKIIENRKLIAEMCGMFQYEVAERICENEGSKKYGIISVITQAFYETKLLFEVSNNFFSPPPKVNSAVILLKRKKNLKIDCDEKLFFKIVKLSFHQRRKTLRNSLKQINLSENLREHTIFDKRPEQLSVGQFIDLTNLINQDLKH